MKSSGILWGQEQSSSCGSQPSPVAPRATPTRAEKPRPTIAERQENQHDRIAKGGKRNASQMAGRP
jgi:hypothetical protein